MTKQLTLLLMAFFCYSLTQAFGSETPGPTTFESNSNEIKCQIISKIQEHKSGTDLNCNIRVQNISGKIHFIKSITLEFVLEAEDKKTKQKSELIKYVSFTKNWIIGDQDFAFYEPMKTEVEEGNKLKIKRVLSCNISKIEYGANSIKQEDLKVIPFEKETAVGLISPVLLKLKFFKSSDSDIGYYKRGIKSKTKPAVRVDCYLKYENSAKTSIKLKDDISINFKVKGNQFKQNLDGLKLNKFEVISKSIFSIYFSNSVNPETMQIFLDAEKSQLLKQ